MRLLIQQRALLALSGHPQTAKPGSQCALHKNPEKMRSLDTLDGEGLSTARLREEERQKTPASLLAMNAEWWDVTGEERTVPNPSRCLTQ